MCIRDRVWAILYVADTRRESGLANVADTIVTVDICVLDLIAFLFVPSISYLFDIHAVFADTHVFLFTSLLPYQRNFQAQLGKGKSTGGK